MKQREKRPARTRQAILDAAAAEFSLHGYAGTGLGAIVARADLTKGALFHHFPDKQSLAAAWIGEHLADSINEMWVAPLQAMGSLDALRTFCRTRCLELRPGDATSALVALTAETTVSAPVLGAALTGVLAAWREGVACLLERGKAGAWIHRSIQPAVEAGFLVAAFCGFSVTTQGSEDEGPRRACATALEGYLETLRAV